MEKSRATVRNLSEETLGEMGWGEVGGFIKEVWATSERWEGISGAKIKGNSSLKPTEAKDGGEETEHFRKQQKASVPGALRTKKWMEGWVKAGDQDTPSLWGSHMEEEATRVREDFLKR